MKGHDFKMLFNLNNSKLIPYLDGLFLMPSDVIINGIKLWSIKRTNCLEVSYNVYLFNNQYFTVMNLYLLS